MQYRNINSGRKTMFVRGDLMRAEEIDRERRQSGWNPYEGEEEVQRRFTWKDQRSDHSQKERMEQGWMESEPEPEVSVQPFFTQPEYAEEMEIQMTEERDLRTLQSMYPEAAKLLLPLVEEECDKMEYEGSPMFDSYPDQTTLWGIQERIKRQVQDQLLQQPVKQPEKTDSDEEEWQEGMETESTQVFSMQYQGRRRGRPGQDWLGDMIRVMLLHEMHHRRCRHGRCRRKKYS